MPRSICVHPSHREYVAGAFKRNGFLTQGDLAAHLEIALSTVNNFCRCVNVSVAKFEEICEALGLEAREMMRDATREDGVTAAIAPSTSSAQAATETGNFFAYDAMWVGRTAQIEKLTAALNAACRLLLLVGISGVGKTALAERLALALLSQPEADWQLIRENFDNREMATDFGSFAARLLERCAQSVTPDERQDPQQLGRRLAQHLQTTPYLLIIDSGEEILTAGESGQSVFQDDGYLLWLQQLLSASECASRLIMTSQALPASLVEVSSRYANFWQVEELRGLSESEQLALFEKAGFELHLSTPIAIAARTYLERIGRAYGGHPLALRVITGEIGSRPFFGNVVAYWKRYGGEIETVEQAISQAEEGNTTGADDDWRLDRMTQTLRRNVRQRLEQTFTRLNAEVRYAYVLLCESAVYRCAVPEDWWLSHLEFWDCDEAAQQAAMEALRDRCLVEESLEQDEWQVRQHNLIRSVSLDHLRRLEQ